MNAEILSVGTEILLGNITDTNATYLTRRLADLGINVYRINAVGDNLGRLSETIRQALSRADLLVITGGLGPTEDDLTREAISAVAAEEMQVQPELEEQLRDYFGKRSVKMPERNVKQATLIPSAKALNNPIGTAPGWWVQFAADSEFAGRHIITMPGVPHEMKRMWQEEVEPELGKLSGGGLIFSLNIKTVGIGESTAEETVGELIHSNNPTVATYAKQDGVHLRVSAKAQTRSEAESLVNGMADEIRAKLGNYIYGYDEETLEAVLGKLLEDQNLTIASMESVTGGLIAHNLTNVPGSSDWFLSGIVSYSPEMKVQSGVPQAVIDEHGVVSAECAKAMATAIRERTGADVGISTTGVAGPSEIEGQPVGTVWLGLDFKGETKASKIFYRSTRAEIKRLASMGAVNQARLALLERAGK